jgi:hypothetical protein
LFARAHPSASTAETCLSASRSNLFPTTTTTRSGDASALASASHWAKGSNEWRRVMSNTIRHALAPR